MNKTHTLYYVHDPMCSWCWGFRPTWLRVAQELPEGIKIKYVLGGLAPDTDTPMPESMRQSIRQTWRRIQSDIPGTRFNFDFWQHCVPRRSTYASCRAVIAARQQDSDADQRMLLAIQQAYYLNARNPADTAVLVDLASQLGLDPAIFLDSLVSEETQRALLDEFAERDRLGADSFPGLYLGSGNLIQPVTIDYVDADRLLKRLMDKINKWSEQHQVVQS
jgi:putative protein-disulfide isomerase